MAAASVVSSSLSLKPASFTKTIEKSGGVKGLPTLSRSSLRVVASGGKKIKTDTPYGTYVVADTYKTPRVISFL